MTEAEDFPRGEAPPEPVAPLPALSDPAPAPENWDDLRYVLAVADAGSVNAAARALGCNHATVLRHVAAFEAAHGTSLFDRGPSGYAIAPEKLPVIEAARSAASAMAAVSHLLRGHGGGAGAMARLRLTSTDSLCVGLLPPVLARLGAEMPELRIELLCSNAQVDLARMTAEIAVRPTPRLPSDMLGDLAGPMRFSVYGQRGVTGWLALRGVLARTLPARLQAEHLDLPEGAETGGADSFLALREMAAAGLGRAILPRFLGQADPRLTEMPGLLPPMEVPVWVACHAELGQMPRLRRLRRRLADLIGPVLEAA